MSTLQLHVCQNSENADALLLLAGLLAFAGRTQHAMEKVHTVVYLGAVGRKQDIQMWPMSACAARRLLLPTPFV